MNWFVISLTQILFLVSTQSLVSDYTELPDAIWKTFISPRFKTENSTEENSCNETCYPEIGCFRPVKHCLPLIYGSCVSPQALLNINTTFMFFSKKNQYNPYTVNFTLPEVELKKVSFNPKLLTVVLVHGYEDQYTENFTLGPIKNLYLNKMNDVNVIAVDWSKGAANPNYAKGKANAKIVGSQIALMLEKLSKIYEVNLDKVMIIGFSLGGQVVAYAGNFTQQRLHKKVGRIIGLDAAGICFDDRIFGKLDPEALNPTQATVVEALHTNAAPLGYGIRGPAGHYDFYPNGGNHQPGCVTPSVIFSLGYEKSYCSHLRKQPLYYVDYELFGECQPVAYDCSNYNDFLKGFCASCEHNRCQLMALGIQISRNELTLKVPTKPNLSLYLRTTAETPYCMFHYQVKASLINGYKPISIDVRLIGENRNETVSLIAGPSDKYYALLTIPEVAGTRVAIRFISAFMLDLFVDGNKSTNIIKKLEINYLSNIDESIRREKSTKLCPASEFVLTLCPQQL